MRHQSSPAATSQAAVAAGGSDDPGLKPSDILLAEFNYAAATANRAKADRASIFTLFLAATGASVTAIGALGNGWTVKAVQPMAIVEVMVLFLAAVLCFAFFVKIYYLGQECHESLIAMNVVKEYYLKRLPDDDPPLADAFRWRLATIPCGERVTGGSSLISYTIAILGSLALAGGVGVLRQVWGVGHHLVTGYLSEPAPWGGSVPLFWEGLAFAVMLLIYVWCYEIVFSPRADHLRLAAVAERLELPEPPLERHGLDAAQAAVRRMVSQRFARTRPSPRARPHVRQGDVARPARSRGR